jgi:hypothetical protein
LTYIIYGIFAVKVDLVAKIRNHDAIAIDQVVACVTTEAKIYRRNLFAERVCCSAGQIKWTHKETCVAFDAEIVIIVSFTIIVSFWPYVSVGVCH